MADCLSNQEGNRPSYVVDRHPVHIGQQISDIVQEVEVTSNDKRQSVAVTTESQLSEYYQLVTGQLCDSGVINTVISSETAISDHHGLDVDADVFIPHDPPKQDRYQSTG